MKRIFFITSSLIIALSLFSCNRCVDGSGKIMNLSSDMKNFKKIEIDIPANIQIRQSNKYSVDIQTDENLLKYIETEVSGNTLKIKSKKCIKDFKVLDINISTPDIEEIVINGSGKIQTSGIIKTKKLYIESNGSSECVLNIDTKETEIDINGSGNFDIRGITEKLELEINGSGSINAFETDVLKAYIEITGSGSCKVKPAEKLDVEISGSGNVYYKGVPEDIAVDASGSGKLVKQ